MATDERQDEARKAWTAMVLRSMAVLLPGGTGGSFGTGTVFATPGGVPFILTARHLFEDVKWQPTHAIFPVLKCGNIRDVADDVLLGPDAPGREPIDVAVVRVRPAAHAMLRDVAQGLDVIAEDDEVDPEDVVVIAGFPAFLLERKTVAPKVMEVGVSSVTHITGVKGRDSKGRLEVDWSEAIVQDTPPAMRHHIQAEVGETFDLGEPQGISGGAVWRIRGPADASEIWSPSKHAKLIGVPVAVRGTTEFAESVVAWRAWLLEAIRWVDGRTESRAHRG